MRDAGPIVGTLQRAGYRLTGQRVAIARLVAGRGGATFTAADLVADARSARLPGIGRATVFRTLDALTGAGAVERLDLPSGEHAYVACMPAHHHHVVCVGCERSVEVGDLGLADVAREASRQTGYRVYEHRLELFGLCPDCQRRGRRSRAEAAAAR